MSKLPFSIEIRAGMNLDNLYKDDAQQLYGGKIPHHTHMQRKYLLQHKTRPQEFIPKLINRSLDAVMGQGLNELVHGATGWGDMEVEDSKVDDKLNEICGDLIKKIRIGFGDKGVEEFRKKVVRMEDVQKIDPNQPDSNNIKGSQVGKIDLKKIKQATADLETINKYAKRVAAYNVDPRDHAELDNAITKKLATSALPDEAVELLCIIELMLGNETDTGVEL